MLFITLVFQLISHASSFWYHFPTNTVLGAAWISGNTWSSIQLLQSLFVFGVLGRGMFCWGCDTARHFSESAALLAAASSATNAYFVFLIFALLNLVTIHSLLEYFSGKDCPASSKDHFTSTLNKSKEASGLGERFPDDGDQDSEPCLYSDHSENSHRSATKCQEEARMAKLV